MIQTKQQITRWLDSTECPYLVQEAARLRLTGRQVEIQTNRLGYHALFGHPIAAHRMLKCPYGCSHSSL
jgi:hypothetical protein